MSNPASGAISRIPFDDAFFDAVLACHACYYVDPGTRFGDNVNEIARVLKPGGSFVFSAPIGHELHHARRERPRRRTYARSQTIPTAFATAAF